MFSSLRGRIAIWFIALSSVVYITLTLAGMWFFHASLISDIDNELKAFAAALGHAIDVRDGAPYFRDWARTVKTEPPKSLVTMQLFDAHGKLLEKYGQPGVDRLERDTKQVSNDASTFRVLCSPLIRDGRTIGFMQLELATTQAEAATRQFALTMALIAPLVLLGLGVTSVVVSGKVSRPFEENMRLLRRFVSDAGHELNTPLSIVQARAEALDRKLSKIGASTDELKSIRESTERMATIVRDLMLLAELEGPIKTAEKTEISLDRIVMDVADEMSDRFQQKQISLDTNDAAPATIQGYPDALHRLFLNLLENAVRYTEPGGVVSVKIRKDDNQVRVFVEDNGIGIPAESLPLVFDRFYRVDKSRSRESGGAGLGLSIVKAIAEAHEGTVRVQSQLGVGTTFTVAIPR